MKISHYLTAGFLGLPLIAGCGQSSAANAPIPTSMVRPTASLAPAVDPGLVRIPETRKSPAVTKKQETPSTDKTVVPVNYVEQERRQEKGQRRQNRPDGKNSESKSFERGDKSERTDKVKEKTTESKKDESKVSVSASVPASNEAPAPSFLETTTPTPTSTAPTNSTFPVTYGSAASSSSRSFKKPTLPGNVPSWYSENDKDGDGQLSMNEWPADKMEEFKKYDRNGDGIITLEEAMRTVPKAAPVVAATTTPAATTTAAATPAPAATTAATPPPIVNSAAPAAGMTMRMGGAATPGAPLSDDDAKRRVEMSFGFVDSNKDGVLDEKEIENSRTIKSVDWKKYDANKDNKLDKNEAIALYKAEGNNMRGGWGGGGPNGGGGGGAFGGRSPDEMAKTMFDNVDKNKTGKVTKEQFPGFMKDRFEEYDTNKDGFVTFEEFKAGFAKFMQNRGGPGGGRGPGGGGPGGGRGGDGNNGGGRGFGGPGGGGMNGGGGRGFGRGGNM